MRPRHLLSVVCLLGLAGCQRGPESAATAAAGDVAGATQPNVPEIPAPPAPPPDVAPTVPPTSDPPTHAAPEISSRFSAASGSIVAQATLSRPELLHVVALHGPSRRVFFTAALDLGLSLRVMDEKGEQRELKQWPEGFLRQLLIEPSGNLLALFEVGLEKLRLEKLDEEGRSLNSQDILGKHDSPLVLAGADGPILTWDGGLGRVRAGEPLVAAVSLNYSPRAAAFDAAGALLLVGDRNRGGAPIEKYSRELHSIWKRSYEGPGPQVANSVVVGADDLVYVGGMTEAVPIDGPDSHRGEDYATDIWLRCYSNAGKLLWDGRYPSPKGEAERRGEYDQSLTGIVLDPDAGVIFVGKSRNANTWIQQVSAEGQAGWWVELANLSNARIAAGPDGLVQVAGELPRDDGPQMDHVWRAVLKPD